MKIAKNIMTRRSICKHQKLIVDQFLANPTRRLAVGNTPVVAEIRRIARSVSFVSSAQPFGDGHSYSTSTQQQGL